MHLYSQIQTGSGSTAVTYLEPRPQQISWRLDIGVQARAQRTLMAGRPAVTHEHVTVHITYQE